MPYNNFANPTPFKWPWSSQAKVKPADQPTSAVAQSAFTFPSNIAQSEEEPQSAFNQPKLGTQRGSRQFAPSFGASSGGGSHFRKW